MTVPLSLQIAEVAREVAMRKRVFPAWVRDSRLTQEEADRRLAAMESVLETLRTVAAERAAAIQPPLL